ncbi:hypothetical protein [Bosea sp. 124]|uniref:hypothetical protein n=1 Tax=Bosea sp. 124 TaxID=2135642 RepID=UPI000D34A605|nr:hypothetical protein [Bosea sp. 124]PTM40353.1 hypothetical protein C8D03_1869 [Bosea sp. 124]
MIERFSDLGAVIHYLQSANTGFETRHIRQALVEYAASMGGMLERMYPYFAKHMVSFEEAPLSTVEAVTTTRERLSSTPLLYHMRIIMRMAQYCCPQTIVEIDGAYGAPGRVWMTNDLHKPPQYIDIDFAESPFCADVYLYATMPVLNIFDLYHGESLPASNTRCACSGVDFALILDEYLAALVLCSELAIKSWMSFKFLESLSLMEPARLAQSNGLSHGSMRRIVAWGF